MIDAHSREARFCNKVYDNYDVDMRDVYKMINEEYEFHIKSSKERKTPKVKEKLLMKSLDNCERWLEEDRKQTTPKDIITYRVAKLWFTSIQKRDGENKNSTVLKKFPEMSETHCKGLITIENIPETPLMDDDLGIMIAEDGRVWICVNGLALLRFKPRHNEAVEEEDPEEKDDFDDGEWIHDPDMGSRG